MPAVDEAGTTAATDRVTEILSAVDALIKVRDVWENEELQPGAPPVPFEDALLAAANACEGDIPRGCHKVVAAMLRLSHEWNQYANSPIGREPLPMQFWDAFRALKSARKTAEAPVRRRLESVASLVSQGVYPNQIARHIYGHTDHDTGIAVGPFILPDGRVDQEKIKQEAEHPGSVIGPDWVHPADLVKPEPASAARFRNAVVRRAR